MHSLIRTATDIGQSYRLPGSKSRSPHGRSHKKAKAWQKKPINPTEREKTLTHFRASRSLNYPAWLGYDDFFQVVQTVGPRCITAIHTTSIAKHEHFICISIGCGDENIPFFSPNQKVLINTFLKSVI